MTVGSIPADWRTRRQLVRFGLDDPLPFLNVDDPETHTFLTEQMAPILEALGVPELDVAAVRGPNRHLTREIAQWAYAATDDDGSLQYSGIRYGSRLGNFECWAIFHGSIVEEQEALAIEKTHPDLLTVARMFDLTVH